VCAVLDAAGKPRLRAEDVLGAALSQFARDYQQFSRGGGFAPFLPRYYARWLHSGQTVEVAQVTTRASVSECQRTGAQAQACHAWRECQPVGREGTPMHPPVVSPPS
jgi:biotin-(acetyl-CoA carboxylase) ligase